MSAKSSSFAVGARLLVVGTAVLFSTGGAVIKATGLTGWQVASFRCGVAALALVVLLPTSRRGWSWRTVVVGCAYAGALIAYAVANKLTTAASTIFLFSVTPLYILFLGPWLLQERIRGRDMVWVAIFAAGLGLVLSEAETTFATAPHPLTGNLVAAAGGFSFALAVMGLRWLSRAEIPHRGSSTAAVLAGNVTAFIACLPMALPIDSAQPRDWMLIGYLGVFQIGLAYVLLTAALRRIPALEASLLLLVEPVLNPLWAWWLHGERPAAQSLAGGAIILAAAAAMTVMSLRSARAVQSYRSQGQ